MRQILDDFSLGDLGDPGVLPVFFSSVPFSAACLELMAILAAEGEEDWIGALVWLRWSAPLAPTRSTPA
jgi:hypothetical protein